MENDHEESSHISKQTEAKIQINLKSALAGHRLVLDKEDRLPIEDAVTRRVLYQCIDCKNEGQDHFFDMATDRQPRCTGESAEEKRLLKKKNQQKREPVIQSVLEELDLSRFCIQVEAVLDFKLAKGLLKQWLSEPAPPLEKLHFRQDIMEMFYQHKELIRVSRRYTKQISTSLESLSSALLTIQSNKKDQKSWYPERLPIANEFVHADLLVRATTCFVELLEDEEAGKNFPRLEQVYLKELRGYCSYLKDIVSLYVLNVLEAPREDGSDGMNNQWSIRSLITIKSSTFNSTDIKDAKEGMLRNYNLLLKELELERASLKITYDSNDLTIQVFDQCWWISIPDVTNNVYPQSKYERSPQESKYQMHIVRTEKIKELSRRYFAFQDLLNDYSAIWRAKLWLVLHRQLPRFYRIQEIVSQFAVQAAFTTLAHENVFPWVRPKLGTQDLVLKGAHHPLLDQRKVVANDINLEHATSRGMLLTGVNGSGKTTILRTTGLICKLGSIGCLVPCESADIPLFDEIYSNIPTSKSRLDNHESSFLQAFKKNEHIIKSATARSLLLFDEMVRHTDKADAEVFSYSNMRKIDREIKAFAIYSTHLVDLVVLEKEEGSCIKNHYLEAIEINPASHNSNSGSDDVGRFKIRVTYKLKKGAYDHAQDLKHVVAPGWPAPPTELYQANLAKAMSTLGVHARQWQSYPEEARKQFKTEIQKLIRDYGKVAEQRGVTDGYKVEKFKELLQQMHGSLQGNIIFSEGLEAPERSNSPNT